MNRRNDLIGVPCIAGLVPELGAALECMFPACPANVVTDGPQGCLVADAAVIGEHLRALAPKRSFNRERDAVFDAHRLESFLAGLRMVIRLQRIQPALTESEPEFIHQRWRDQGDERPREDLRMMIDHPVVAAGPLRQAKVRKCVLNRAREIGLMFLAEVVIDTKIVLVAIGEVSLAASRKRVLAGLSPYPLKSGGIQSV